MSLQLPCHREGFCCPLPPSWLVLTPGSKENPIAWLVAIRPPVVLGTSRGKGVAQGQGGFSHAPQASPPKRLPGMSVPWPGGDERGQEAVLLPSPCPQMAWSPAANLRVPKSWLVWGPPSKWWWSWELATEIAFGEPPGQQWGWCLGDSDRHRSHLCMPSWGQDTVAVLTFQAEAVPVLAQGAHLLRCGEQGRTGTSGQPS